MVNTHFSLDYPRPLVPAMIPVGGLHITPGKELPSVSEREISYHSEKYAMK
jgi:hypothetical protein